MRSFLRDEEGNIIDGDVLSVTINYIFNKYKKKIEERNKKVINLNNSHKNYAN